ncbi:hypothetical protein N7447_008239 [Penicillium robsamsonii]|uniref:uncharacterized protein n=1 Tax=Penicillium robsamsonii TaxID=1792511 RepID=UPI00254925A5|nr:uncharacterized protein N7447_008239 [Penicillium robsamsonii]KAJ5816006.1 hypothetical protein N7447_008239 [Penicillium robsamsonii]
MAQQLVSELLNGRVTVFGGLGDLSLEVRAVLGGDLGEDLSRVIKLHIPLNGVVHKEQPRMLLLALAEAIDASLVLNELYAACETTLIPSQSSVMSANLPINASAAETVVLKWLGNDLG